MGDDSVRLARSTVLRLRGLPFQATEADIKQFFEGYTLTHCSICKRNGRATGEAYVQLESEALAAKALTELNCKYVGRRYIEIFEALESDMAASAAGEMKELSGFVLRLRGLPYSATRADVESFFEGLEICKGDEGVVFAVTSLGKPTGEAYVEFVTEQSQLEAMKKHKHHMGSRYIELFKSTKADLLQALQQNKYYKDEAQKRQILSRTVIGMPTADNQQRIRMQGYGFQVDEVSDVLKGLSVSDRSSLMLSPPYQSPANYDRAQGFRAPPLRQYVPHHSGYMNHQYFIPEQLPNRLGTMGGMYPGGKIYDAALTQRQGMMHHDVYRPQPYLLRPHLMQQPHQMMVRYPAQGTWEPPHDPLNHVNSPLTPSFSHQYSGSFQSGMEVSPSGPGPAPYPTNPYATSLPDMFEGDSFDFAQSAAATRKTN